MLQQREAYSQRVLAAAGVEMRKSEGAKEDMLRESCCRRVNTGMGRVARPLPRHLSPSLNTSRLCSASRVSSSLLAAVPNY